jgi:Ino eighty subunit 1
MFVNETPGAGIPATPGSGFTNTFGHHGSPGRGATLAFQPPNTGDHVPTPSYQAQKRHRGVTQHQNAIINHRKQQIDYTLDRRIRKIHIRARDKREEEGAFFRAWKRIKRMPTDYDSEEEMIKSRKGRDRPDKDDDYRRTKEPQNGADDTDWRRARSVLAGFVRVDNEASDLGEEAKALARSLRQCSRRLDRWQEASRPGQAVMLSRGRQADGLLYARRPSVSWEDDAIDDDVPPAPVIKKIAPKPRKSTSKGKDACKMRIRVASFTKHADTPEDHQRWGSGACKCVAEWVHFERDCAGADVTEHSHDQKAVDEWKRSEGLAILAKIKCEEGNSCLSNDG